MACSKNKRRLHKRGVVTLYIVFLIVAIAVVFISAILAPMGVRFSSEMYQAGEDILRDANSSLAGIDDATVRTTVTDTVGEALGATQNNIEINANIFQYGWIFVLILAFIILFIITRQTVEYSSRFGGFV